MYPQREGKKGDKEGCRWGNRNLVRREVLCGERGGGTGQQHTTEIPNANSLNTQEGPSCLLLVYDKHKGLGERKRVSLRTLGPSLRPPHVPFLGKNETSLDKQQYSFKLSPDMISLPPAGFPALVYKATHA